jgi:hypothetical protein
MGLRKSKTRTAYSEAGGAAAPMTIKDLADLLCALAPESTSALNVEALEELIPAA